jgi:hypothetical protein
LKAQHYPITVIRSLQVRIACVYRWDTYSKEHLFEAVNIMALVFQLWACVFSPQQCQITCKTCTAHKYYTKRVDCSWAWQVVLKLVAISLQFMLCGVLLLSAVALCCCSVLLLGDVAQSCWTSTSNTDRVHISLQYIHCWSKHHRAN